MGKKEKYNYPTLEQFLEHARTLVSPEKFELLKFAIEAKYKAWSDDGWVDGNGKKIKNWKSKLNSNIPFMKEFIPTTTTQNTYKPIQKI